MAPARSRRPTMRDVAERAGVSFKTVSRVVNDEGSVSEDLTTRVHHAIAGLGYHRDDRARRLRQGGGGTGAIGFVLVDVANPFFSSILRGIEEVARTRGCLVFAGSTDGVADRERQLVEAFVARRVDGLIVVSSTSTAGPLTDEMRRGTPVVFLDLEPDDLTVDLVRSDHLGGAELATAHLHAHGHRDIAFFGDDESIFSARLRQNGYRRAMRRAGLDVSDHRVTAGRHSSDEWREIIGARLTDGSPPTALFTAQNFITIGAALALHDLGLHETIALVGFDDVELAEALQPGVSVVPQRPRELGCAAAELLFRRIEGYDGPATREVFRSTLVARGSGEIPPAGWVPVVRGEARPRHGSVVDATDL